MKNLELSPMELYLVRDTVVSQLLEVNNKLANLKNRKRIGYETQVQIEAWEIRHRHLTNLLKKINE